LNHIKDCFSFFRDLPTNLAFHLSSRAPRTARASTTSSAC